MLFGCAIIMSTAHASSVSLLSYRNMIFNLSALIFSWDCFVNPFGILATGLKLTFQMQMKLISC